MPPAAEYFVGMVDGEPVAHLAVCPFFTANAYRATRLVVMPEWQGAGVGTKFLEAVCEHHKAGGGRCAREYPTLFHTSHPQLIAYLNRSPLWVLKSQAMFGAIRSKSMATINKANRGRGGYGSLKTGIGTGNASTGYGGHFRAVQGFKYIGAK